MKWLCLTIGGITGTFARYLLATKVSHLARPIIFELGRENSQEKVRLVMPDEGVYYQSKNRDL